jgi:hypothetical protein
LKPYLPSNGTEGIKFEEKWCEKCTRHSLNPGSKTQCKHLIRALAGENNGRWFFNENGLGECTAFRSKKEAYRNRKRSAKKDKNQLPLFD